MASPNKKAGTHTNFNTASARLNSEQSTKCVFLRVKSRVSIDSHLSIQNHYLFMRNGKIFFKNALSSVIVIVSIMIFNKSQQRYMLK